MNLNDPVTALHAETPLRVWSLIVTIFGDIVMRQGRERAPEPVWVGALLLLLERLRIDPAQVRTNLSRLVANGTLERAKSGRNAFYRIGEADGAAFAEAANRIYGRLAPEPTGVFHVALIDRCVERMAAREALQAAGFRFMSATSAIAPEHRGVLVSAAPSETIIARADCSTPLAVAASEAWQITALNEGYIRFLQTFSPIICRSDWTPDAAIAARIVLVHQFRRLVLRDPVLPQGALPDDWTGGEARRTFDACMATMLPASEAWLAAHGL